MKINLTVNKEEGKEKPIYCMENGKEIHLNGKAEKFPHGILTAQEVGRLLRIPISTIYDLAQKGKIKAVKFGKHWRFLKEDIKAYLHGEEQVKNTLSPDADQRQFARIRAELPAHICGLLSETKSIEHRGQIKNLSEGGILFTNEGDFLNGHGSPDFRNLEVGDPISVVFQLPGLESEKLELVGRIVYLSENGQKAFGIKFKTLSVEEQEVIREHVG